ncbi:succinate-semialdehyde dehydrogenase/glutarate-semialdehyde dehydrogenase [Spinactinospora alkalitolerans]|uniref:Succinate-semialdehyde dehydrogenase/glutarate-semialdehyde dehydrogenase n=1 Tax=Spinactinospora alkalitolerans TaxID=687207 RepID=A0A852U2N0_9ACTN|nr:NAD-dependent succinate-semialdehyde dehydrogenase [Spinactinospora alkalitolerans]NYE50459.1 succinate-semialdehyde dehydrogenase/glutarate-semialdehyde dehydrogenase [Spinactinospora alkalitolerans]
MSTSDVLLEPDPLSRAAVAKVVARIGADRAAVPNAIPVRDPHDDSVIGYVPDLGTAEALDAVSRADAAGRDWAATTPRHRADVLRRWYDLLIDNADDIALLITLEMGKTLADARAEVTYGADFVRWYAEETTRHTGTVREAPMGGARLLTRRVPVGLAVLITPWNFPLAMATRKIAPALAAGCAAVTKPATLTPLTTLFAVQLAVAAGVPGDLLQTVTTSNAGAFSNAVLADPRVRKVSFTGSTGVGKVLLRLAADNVLKSSMELGGNAPFIVFDDADLERAVEGAFNAKMRNGGQSCIAANRFLVQDGIADAFVEGLTERLTSLRMGSGLASGVGLGPMVDHNAVDRLHGLVDDAVGRGAKLLTHGRTHEGPGSYFGATVVDHVPADAEVATTEIFGPIAAVQRFSTQEEAVTRANDTEFGLAGYVFTESLDRAFHVADSLGTGIVGINQGVPSNAAAPFGGVKESGLGREGSAEGLEEYQEIRFYNLALRSTS